MALNFTVAPVTFTKGLDTHAARKLVVPGKWDTLINASLAEDGSLKRRDGFEALISAQAGNGLATRDNELLIFNGPDVSTVSEVGANVAKQVPGTMPNVDMSKSEVVFNGANHDSADMAYGSGYACYVWRDYSAGGGTVTGISCTLVDLSSGAKLVNNTALYASATAISPRVVFANGAFFIFYVDTSNIYCNVIAASAPTTVGTRASVQLDVNIVLKNIDACAFGTQAIVAYVYGDGTTSVRAIAVTRSGTTPSTTAGPLNVVSEANVTNASTHALAVCGYSATVIGVFLVHVAGGALAGGLVGATITDATFTVATAATLLDNTVPPVSSATHVTAVAVGSNIQTFFDQQSSYLSANIRPLQSGVWSPTLVAVTSAYTVVRSACFDINAARASGPQGPFIAGKAFTSGSSVYLPVTMLENFLTLSLGANTATNSTQCAFFVLQCDAGSDPVFSVVGGALYRTLGLLDPTGGGAAPTVSTPCSTPALATGFGICLQERGRLEITNGFNRTLVGLSHLTMTPRTTTPGLYRQVAETLYASGGQLAAYDSLQCVQAGFPMFPEGISAVVSAPGGGTKLTVGVHQVVAVYEWYDGAGSRCQSAPSLPVSVTVNNASDQIDVLVPTTQLAQQAGYASNLSTLTIVCYMTAAGGLTFYRAIQSFAPVVNNPTASTVSYTIGAVVMTDDRLTTNEALYAQPNQAGTTLPNLAPGPVSALAVSQERLWYLRADRPLEYAYSQEPIQNTALQFNSDALGGLLPADSGGGVAICELDEKTIVFGARKIYAIYGSGPTPSGGFNNFSEPQPIPSDVGCTEARSVMQYPGGIIFKSDKGWYVLGRDLSTRYIGEGVSRWDEYDVSAAVMMEDRQEIRFTSSNSSGPTLVYSYLSDAWSVFYLGNLLHPGSVSAAAWWPATGRFVHLQPSTGAFPGLMQDTPGVYVDGAGLGGQAGFFVYARTGWLHVGSLEGFQRVRKMYMTATAAAAPTTPLVISVDFDDMYDLDADGAYSMTVDLATITFDNIAAIDLRHKLSRMKCKSVAFSFLEGSADELLVPLTGMQAMSLEVGIKTGVNRLPATQSVG